MRRACRDPATLARHEQAILAVIYRFEQHNGLLPGVDRFRAWFGMSNDQFYNTINRLRERGLIATTGGPGHKLRAILMRRPAEPIPLPLRHAQHVQPEARAA